MAVVAFIMSWHEERDGHGAAGERGRLAGFRRELYLSLGLRRDVLFEACDAALCKPGRVLMLAELCLEPECRRGHGGLYDALNCGEVRVARLRRALSALPLPAWPDGRIRLAVDVSNWLRPDAATSPDRSFCHCYGRGKSSAQMIPGWPYSLVAALERGRTSWTLPLDAVRLRPDDDLAAVTAAQVRDVVTRLAAAGHWKDGDPDIMVIFDAGYEPARLAWLLRDLPVQVTGRLGTNRVFRRRRRPAGPARWAGQCGTARSSRSPRTPPGRNRTPSPPPRPAGTGPPSPLPGTGCTRSCTPAAHGKATGATTGHRGHRHPADRRSPAPRPRPKPVWLWTSDPAADPAEADRCWQAFLRRFDIEHTFRFLKQPRLDRAQAPRHGRRRPVDLDCHRLPHPAMARPRPHRRPPPALAAPGPRPATPARVRRGFRNIHGALPCLAGAPKPGKPGPGRPPGSKNRRPATRHDVGKTAGQFEICQRTAG